MVDKLMTTICIIMVLSNSSFSLIAPFYPLEVKHKKIDVIWIGFIMGCQSFTFIISSFFTGRHLGKIGRTKGIIVGVLLIVSFMQSYFRLEVLSALAL